MISLFFGRLNRLVYSTIFVFDCLEFEMHLHALHQENLISHRFAFVFVFLQDDRFVT